MGIEDDAVEIRAQGWRTIAALHGLIEAELERSLQGGAELSVVEFTVLDALSRQDGWHMRMQQLAGATALSSSATTPKNTNAAKDQMAMEPPKKVQSTLVQSPLPLKIIGMTRCSGKVSIIP